MKCSTSWSISNTHIQNHSTSNFFSIDYFQMYCRLESEWPHSDVAYTGSILTKINRILLVQVKAEFSPKVLTGKNYVRLPSLTEAYFSWLAPLPLWTSNIFFGWKKSKNLRSFFVQLKPHKFGEPHINRHMRAFSKTADNSSNFLLHWKNKLSLFS